MAATEATVVAAAVIAGMAPVGFETMAAVVSAGVATAILLLHLLLCDCCSGCC